MLLLKVGGIMLEWHIVVRQYRVEGKKKYGPFTSHDKGVLSLENAGFSRQAGVTSWSKTTDQGDFVADLEVERFLDPSELP